MSAFSELQANHEELVKAQDSGEILEQVQKYIDDIKHRSSQVSSIKERDQLRANLRYWASYVYGKTGEYPNTELLPSSETPHENRSIIIYSLIVAIAIFLVYMLSYFGLILPQQTVQVTKTDQAEILATAQSATETQISLASAIAPTETSQPTKTSIPVTGTPIKTNGTVRITSVKDGDKVKAITLISGDYSNLSPGSSIHLIVQPVLPNALHYPIRQYASVSANSTSGEWTISVQFGQGIDLEKQTDYVVSAVLAPDQITRDRLDELVDSGFQEYPIWISQPRQEITVTRVAYTVAIDGIQMIYSSYLDAEGNWEIFTMDPGDSDDSKRHRITYTSSTHEMFPSLSPDGRQIVYVSEKRDNNNKPINSIRMMNSDGTNDKELISYSSLIYEQPLFSYDGQYIAYVVGTPQVGESTTWNISAYDIQQQKSFQIAAPRTNHYYYCWIPKSLEMVFNEAISNKVTNSKSFGFVQVNILDTSKREVFFDPIGDQWQPAISSDGTKLAYMQHDYDSGVSIPAGNIYVVDLETNSIPLQLTNGKYQDQSPVWASDGKTIFFESYESVHVEIWFVRSDGPNNPTSLATGKDKYPFVGYMYAIIP